MTEPNYNQRKRRSYDSRYAHITPEALVRHRAEGLTTSQIAELYGIPRGTAAWLARKYGIAGPKRGFYERRKPSKPRKPKQEIVELLDVTVTPEQERVIRELYGGAPRREIAKRLKLDKVTLNLMIIKLGLGS